MDRSAAVAGGYAPHSGHFVIGADGSQPVTEKLRVDLPSSGLTVCLPVHRRILVVRSLHLPEIAVVVVDVLDRKVGGIGDRVNASGAVVRGADRVGSVDADGEARCPTEAVIAQRSRVAVVGACLAE